MPNIRMGRWIGIALATFAPLAAARAEVAEVQITQQFGIGNLPLMLMQHDKLVEKQAAARGLADLKATFTAFTGPTAMVEGILSGALHVALLGPPSLALLWDKTNGNVKSIGGITTYNLYLNTRNPDIKSIRDFTDKDRIALPGVKTSAMSIMLQMAAEREFGPGQQFKLDPLTVALGHPDGMTAVLNPKSEIDAHFTSSPFHEREVKAGLRTITTANDINGGQSSAVLLAATEKFRGDNPKVYAAVIAAVDEAVGWLKADERRAVKLYLEMAKGAQMTEEDGIAMLKSSGFEFTRTPHNVGNVFNFMARVGLIKSKPASWKDLFFPEAASLPGS